MTAVTVVARVRAAAADSVLVRFVIRTSAALGPDGAARLPISPWEPETAWLRDEVRSTHIGRGAAVLARAVWRVWTGASARRVLAADKETR